MGKGSRRARRAQAGHIPLDIVRARSGLTTRQSAPDGDWMVRQAGPAAKTYRCPGCDQVIEVGQANVVAWQADGLFGAEAALADRRHWHRTCWNSR